MSGLVDAIKSLVKEKYAEIANKSKQNESSYGFGLGLRPLKTSDC
jgi:hypothetical protein